MFHKYFYSRKQQILIFSKNKGTAQKRDECNLGRTSQNCVELILKKKMRKKLFIIRLDQLNDSEDQV